MSNEQQLLNSNVQGANDRTACSFISSLYIGVVMKCVNLWQIDHTMKSFSLTPYVIREVIILYAFLLKNMNL